MRVFVAGATGAVGRELIPQLLAAGHSVVAISRQQDKAEMLRRPRVDVVVCDVFDRERLRDVVRQAAPDAIIHQLTDLPATMNPRQLGVVYARNNRVRRDGTANLISAARAANVPRFIVQSMATWYKPAGGPIKTEADPLWLDAPEPIGTAVRTAAEMEAAVMKETPLGVVLRYGAFYGPGTWYAADGEITRRMRQRQFPIVGKGDGLCSFIHVADAASAAIAALSAPAPGIYNVADSEPARASEWMPALAETLQAPPPRRVPAFLARLVLGKAMTEWLTSMRGAANAKVVSELRWTPRYPSWREGFRHL